MSLTYVTTGLWKVKPEVRDGEQSVALVHMDSIVHAVHLIGVYQDTGIPFDLDFFSFIRCFRNFLY
jgi:hypothetical protein